jgi:hypothetical protein
MKRKELRRVGPVMVTRFFCRRCSLVRRPSRATSVATFSLSAGITLLGQSAPRGTLDQPRKLLRFGLQIGSPTCVQSLAAARLQKRRRTATTTDRLGLLSCR